MPEFDVSQRFIIENSGARGEIVRLREVFREMTEHITYPLEIKSLLGQALAAAVLLASFIGTGSSFLAFAIVAEKRQLQSLAFPDKSFYFLGGLTEATETLIAFVAMCLWPQWFAPIAYGFAALCAITTALRIGWGYSRFR